MIEDAEAKGLLSAGSTIVEPTSGTPASPWRMAAAKGVSPDLTMPETMSVERRNIMKAYGAQLVLTEGAKGMKGRDRQSRRLAREIPNSFIPGSSRTPPIPPFMPPRRVLRSGKTPTVAVDIFVAASEPAARSRVRADI